MQKNREMIKKLVTIAMLVAISIVISSAFKALNLGSGPLRVTFENFTIILSGILYGPIVGGIVGLLTDLSSFIVTPQTAVFLPVVTLGATMVGVVSGIVSKFIVRKKGAMQIVLSGAAAHLIGTLIIKTVGLFPIFGVLTFGRIPIYLIIAPIEIALLCMLLKRDSFARIVGYTSQTKGKKK